MSQLSTNRSHIKATTNPSGRTGEEWGLFEQEA